MTRSKHRSPQTLAVLAALANAPGEWRHGVSLTRETGLKSGTLYPLLIRLDEAGFLESRWLPSEPPGKPPRHVYRLTRAGIAQCAQQLSSGPDRGTKAVTA